MREKNLYPLFQNWLKDNMHCTGAYELKISKGNSLPFDSVKPHQVRSLRMVKNAIFTYKISDFDMIGWKPFDIFCMTNAAAYVVIVFYKPRKPIRFILIDIDEWCKEVERSDKKSITEDRARVIATIVSTF